MENWTDRKILSQADGATMTLIYSEQINVIKVSQQRKKSDFFGVLQLFDVSSGEMAPSSVQPQTSIKDQFQAQFNLNVQLTLCSAQSTPDPVLKMKFSALLLHENSGSLLELQRC